MTETAPSENSEDINIIFERIKQKLKLFKAQIAKEELDHVKREQYPLESSSVNGGASRR